MIADKDKEIAELKADVDAKAVAIDSAKTDIESLNGIIAEKDKNIEENAKAIAKKDEEIQKLQAQVDSLKAEVKELSEKPAPMVDAGAGIPAGNGTGDAPQQKGSRIKRGMSYKQIREAMKDDK
jgi:Tfp pilus assembly protein FimV